MNKKNIMLKDTDSDIIGITESWTNKDIPDAEIGLTGYVPFRRDRIKSKGGGLFYVLNNLFRLTKSNNKGT